MAKRNKKEIGLIISGELVDNTKKVYPYRNLNEGEVDELVALYDIHHGRIATMCQDTRCQFKSRTQMTYYCKLYNFKGRLEQFRTDFINKHLSEKNDLLKKGKGRALQCALNLLETRPIDIHNKDGEMLTVMKEPTAKEIEIAWKIIKTELGEPINIPKPDKENYIDDKDKDLKRNAIIFIDFENDTENKQIL